MLCTVSVFCLLHSVLLVSVLCRFNMLFLLLFQFITLCYQNLRNRLGIECHPYTKSRIDQIPCVCMYVCMCNYSSQTTEPICIKITQANRASYVDCYRLLKFEIFTPTIFRNQKPISGGPVMLNQWEIEDFCKAHSKINRKIFTVYG